MWETEFNTSFDNNTWNKIVMFPYVNISATKLRYFQYRVINKYITTNVRRSKWSEVSPKCSFCCRQWETVHLLLWSCPVTQGFWKALKIWLERKCRNEINFSEQDVMLCCYNGWNAKLINTLFLIIKQYLYATRCLKTTSSFIGAMSNVTEYYKVEKAIANRSRKMHKFKKTWGIFIDL